MAAGQATISVGLCQCGCGKKTMIAARTREDRKHVKGQPMPFLHQHSPRRLKRNLARHSGLEWCRRCEQAKPKTDFFFRKDGMQGVCKTCSMHSARNWRQKNRTKYRSYMADFNLKRLYGISSDEYQRLFENQNGACAICTCPERLRRKDGTPRNLHVDHDHKTGKIRGLLCHYCNTAIGAMRENEDLLLKAIAYLHKHKGGA